MLKMIHSKRAGFTLIEVMIAFAVLVGAISGLLMVISNGMKIKEMNREQTLAEQGLNDKISEIKAVTFDNIVTNYSSGGTPGNSFTVPGLTSSAGSIAMDSTNTSLLSITITITWSGVTGNSQTYTATTMITR